MERFCLFSEKLSDEEYGDYISYGLEIHGENGEVTKISDLSLNKQCLANFCELLNSGDVNPLELQDLIDDFLADTQYYI